MKYIINSIISTVSGILWRLGGSDGFSKGVRRYGVSGIMGTIAVVKTKKVWVGFLTMGLLVGATSIGYGESSAVAEFVNNLGIYDSPLLDIVIRAICGFAYGFAFLPTIIALRKYKYLYTILLPIVLCPAIRLLGNITGAVVEEFLMGFMVIFSYLLIKE